MSRIGLSCLGQVELSPERDAELGRHLQGAQGPRPWRARLEVELRELFALEAIGSRVRVDAVAVSTELRAFVRMQVPVPCLPPGSELSVQNEVDLVLRYPPDILRRPLAGMELVAIRSPHFVWHPNISAPAADGTPKPQSVCLGANVPRGLPLREALVGTYAALTLQVLTLDERDPAGILNPAALEFWRDRRERVPLSTEPFLGRGTA